jgi:hypothetical protein
MIVVLGHYAAKTQAGKRFVSDGVMGFALRNGSGPSERPSQTTKHVAEGCKDAHEAFGGLST